MVFGVLWILAWWNYSGKFVVIASAVTYYFNSSAEKEGQAEVLYAVKLAHHTTLEVLLSELLLSL